MRQKCDPALYRTLATNLEGRGRDRPQERKTLGFLQAIVRLKTKAFVDTRPAIR